MTIHRILVIEDDREVREMLRQYLSNHGYAVVAGQSLADLKEHFDRWRIDLIVLDIMLDGESGLSICRYVRDTSDVPVIFATALGTDRDRLEGYRLGADDYIVKPFNPAVLLAHVRAVLHRMQRAPSLGRRQAPGNFTFCGWDFDSGSGVLLSPQQYEVLLSQREKALLTLLLASPNIPISREILAGALIGSEDEGREYDGRAIDILVSRLRKKLELNPKAPRMVVTVRGLGYMLQGDVRARD